MTPPTIEPATGGVCAPDGFAAGGIAAGLKPSGKPDLAVVVAPATVTAAAVFTRNQVKAAPVLVSQAHLAATGTGSGAGTARAVLLNSGSANVCTGPDGLALAEEGTAVVAADLGCDPAEVLTCSTGVIGVPIPRDPYLAGIPGVLADRTADAAGGHRAARAIMTTDRAPKEAAVTVTDAQGSAVVGGMAKGAGMIAPSMATMLAVVTTDARLDPAEAGELLRAVTDRTFNRISVDGCASTNDTLILLASGTAAATPSPESLAAALEQVCGDLATQMVRDGEGAQHVLHLQVTGARTEEEALAVARQVGTDNLVKTALAGGDPNWGRVIAAVGAAPVPIDPAAITIAFGDVTVCRGGVVTDFVRADAEAVMRKPDVDCRIDLGQGDAAATFTTCDLTTEYVRINSEYTT